MSRIVLPSEWAKLDVITLPVYQQLCNPEYMENPAAMNIEKLIVPSTFISQTAFGGAFAFGSNTRKECFRLLYINESSFDSSAISSNNPYQKKHGTAVKKLQMYLSRQFTLLKQYMARWGRNGTLATAGLYQTQRLITNITLNSTNSLYLKNSQVRHSH